MFIVMRYCLSRCVFMPQKPFHAVKWVQDKVYCCVASALPGVSQGSESESSNRNSLNQTHSHPLPPVVSQRPGDTDQNVSSSSSSNATTTTTSAADGVCMLLTQYHKYPFISRTTFTAMFYCDVMACAQGAVSSYKFVRWHICHAAWLGSW